MARHKIGMVKRIAFIVFELGFLKELIHLAWCS